jgi:hypothetical protein
MRGEVRKYENTLNMEESSIQRTKAALESRTGASGGTINDTI